MNERAFEMFPTMPDSDDDFAFEWEDPAAHCRAAVDSPPEEAPEGWKGSPIQAGMRAVYRRLKQLRASLEASPLDIRVDYEVPDAGMLENLLQGGYKLEVEHPRGLRFSLAYRCVGSQRLSLRADSRPERDEHMRQLARHGLDAIIEDAFGSQWHFTLVIRPNVPVRLRFEADVAQQVMRMTLVNLDGLGSVQCSAPADAINEAFLDELERLILRRANRFAELTGNVVDNRVRLLMRQAIEARQRRRAAELGENEVKPESSERGPGGFNRLLGRKGEAGHGEHSATPRVLTAPTFVGPRDDDGALEWNSGAKPAEVAPPAAAAGAPASYGWLITAGAMEDTAANLGRLGPPGASRQFPIRRVLMEGREFRLRDRDGQVAFTGKIAGKFRGAEPLNDFGLDHGCMRIEYRRDGKWLALRIEDNKAGS